MSKAYASGVVAAERAALWRFIRPFDDLDLWLPAVARAVIEEGLPADQIGCVRCLDLKDGGDPVRERLVALSDHETTFTYAMIEPNIFDVRDYVATVRLHDITATKGCYIEWCGTFKASADKQEALVKLFAGDIYAVGIAELAKRFGA